jgi:hypothetical protein
MAKMWILNELIVFLEPTRNLSVSIFSRNLSVSIFKQKKERYKNSITVNCRRIEQEG